MENSNEELKLDDKVFEYIEGVFLGIETRVFEMAKEKEGGLEKLVTREGMLYGMNLMEYYLNEVYKNLVDKKDEYLVNQFNELGSLINHHPVYTLNIISNVIMKCYPLMTRSKLNVENNEKYLESVKNIAQNMRKFILMHFHEDLKKLNVEKTKIKDEEKKEAKEVEENDKK